MVDNALSYGHPHRYPDRGNATHKHQNALKLQQQYVFKCNSITNSITDNAPSTAAATVKKVSIDDGLDALL
jgi:hypothetical protein